MRQGRRFDINGMQNIGQGQGGGRGQRGGGRGRGGGQGGGRGQGGGGRRSSLVCTCPECGTQVSHQPGVPCYTIMCPRCGQAMVGR